MNLFARLFRPLTAWVLLLLVLLACGTSPNVIPTIDSNTIATAVIDTAMAIAAMSQTSMAIVPIVTPSTTNTPEPTVTEATVPSSTPMSGQTAVGASCIPNNPPQTGRVVDVVDGDTIKVLLDQDGQTYTIRYIGMDTPESTTQVEYFGAEASAKNAELVYGKTATLIKDVSETDRYGRLLRYVIVDNVFINYELVAQGYANTASYPPDIACIPTFQAAEQTARASSLGLWGAPPTVPPLPTQAPAAGGGGGNDNSGSGSGGNCHPSYPTVCIPPPPPDLDCKDVPYDGFQVLEPDPHRFDGDDDGVGCEG